MMNFLVDIFVPLIVAAIVVGIISTLLNVILRILHLDISLIKVIAFFVVWYFIGPIIYNFLVINIIHNENEIISFIYTPVQTIMGLLNLKI